jgi:hypothetical protein
MIDHSCTSNFFPAMPRVRLADIIDEIKMEFEEAASFLNFDSGEVETVSHEFLRRAEE